MKSPNYDMLRLAVLVDPTAFDHALVEFTDNGNRAVVRFTNRVTGGTTTRELPAGATPYAESARAFRAQKEAEKKVVDERARMEMARAADRMFGKVTRPDENAARRAEKLGAKIVQYSPEEQRARAAVKKLKAAERRLDAKANKANRRAKQALEKAEAAKKKQGGRRK